MSYAQFGSIQAADFNTFVGGNPTTTANTLNAVWGSGGNLSGYGQTAVANVAVGQAIVAPGQWAALVANTQSAASHQGAATVIGTVVTPVAGGLVNYQANIPTNLANIYGNRTNAASQGSTVATSNSRATTWSTSLTFTFTTSFANGDAARYFFNSGGQLKITASSPAGTSVTNIFNQLAANVGTLVMSSLGTSGNANIAGTLFQGLERIGSLSITPSPYVRTAGYYGISGSAANIFQVTNASGTYINTNIKVLANTSTANVSGNGDNGNVITLQCVWTDLPQGTTANSGSSMTLTVVPPELTYLSNTWGAITVVSTLTGT